MKKTLSYFLVVMIIIFTIFAFATSHEEILSFYSDGLKESLLVLSISFTVYLLLIGRFTRFYENFFHELTHMLFSIAFFDNIKHFFASQTHGEVVTGSSFRNILTQTSPYFFPLITTFLMAIWPENVGGTARVVIPISYGVFLAIIVRQIVHHKQEILDFKWYGVLFVIVMNFWISMYIFSWYDGRTEQFAKILKFQEYERGKISNNNKTFGLSDIFR
jgi:hypothetical protein